MKDGNGNIIKGRVKDRTGVTVGDVTILSFHSLRNHRALWNCRCSCGKEFVTVGKNVYNKNTTSCGCKHRLAISKSRSLPYGESAFNQLFKSYRNTANKRNLDFELLKDEFREIVNKDCFYCGMPPTYKTFTHKQYKTGGYICNGIDRVDNNIGYVNSNIVPCCRHCNTMKMTMTTNDFLDKVTRIYMRHVLCR
jgi:hypothetical protein